MVGLLQKYERLLKVIARASGAVAFSGGVDSSLLLKAASDVFGAQTIAFFANSVLQTESDSINAVQTAIQLGVTLQVVEISPLLWQNFSDNPPDRCYLCKKAVYQQFIKLFPAPDMVLFDGSNLDDLMVERPGRKAIVELGVVTPLIEADLNKADIRQLAKYLDIPTWNRESSSCLATRIPTGNKITEGELKLVAKYESILLALGFSGCRVRLAKEGAQSVTIEVKENDIYSLCRPETRQKVKVEFEKNGARHISLSFRGR